MAEECSGHGRMVSGVCRCDAGYSGDDLWLAYNDCQILDWLFDAFQVAGIVLGFVLFVMCVRVFWSIAYSNIKSKGTTTVLFIQQCVFAVCDVVLSVMILMGYRQRNVESQTPLFTFCYFLAGSGLLSHEVIVGKIWFTTLALSREGQQMTGKCNSDFISTIAITVIWSVNLICSVGSLTQPTFQQTFFQVSLMQSWLVTLSVLSCQAYCILSVHRILRYTRESFPTPPSAIPRPTTDENDDQQRRA